MTIGKTTITSLAEAHIATELVAMEWQSKAAEAKDPLRSPSTGLSFEEENAIAFAKVAVGLKDYRRSEDGKFVLLTAAAIGTIFATAVALNVLEKYNNAPTPTKQGIIRVEPKPNGMLRK